MSDFAFFVLDHYWVALCVVVGFLGWILWMIFAAVVRCLARGVFHDLAKSQAMILSERARSQYREKGQFARKPAGN